MRLFGFKGCGSSSGAKIIHNCLACHFQSTHYQVLISTRMIREIGINRRSYNGIGIHCQSDIGIGYQNHWPCTEIKDIVIRIGIDSFHLGHATTWLTFFLDWYCIEICPGKVLVGACKKGWGKSEQAHGRRVEIKGADLWQRQCRASSPTSSISPTSGWLRANSNGSSPGILHQR